MKTLQKFHRRYSKLSRDWAQKTGRRTRWTAWGSWVVLAVALLYLTAYVLVHDKADLAVSVAFAALSLSIRAYGAIR